MFSDLTLQSPTFWNRPTLKLVKSIKCGSERSTDARRVKSTCALFPVTGDITLCITSSSRRAPRRTHLPQLMSFASKEQGAHLNAQNLDQCLPYPPRVSENHKKSDPFCYSLPLCIRVQLCVSHRRLLLWKDLYQNLSIAPRQLKKFVKFHWYVTVASENELMGEKRGRPPWYRKG